MTRACVRGASVAGFLSVQPADRIPREWYMPGVTILTQVCKGIDECGICAYVCPEHLFESSKEMNESGYYPPKVINQEGCTGCRNCMICCPDFAIIVDKDAVSAAKEDNHAAKG